MDIAEFWELRTNDRGKRDPSWCQFLDTQVSLAPTHVSKLVRPSVGHTFGFPISGQ